MLDDSPYSVSKGLWRTMEKTMKCCHYNGDQRALWQPDTWSPLWLWRPFVPVFHIWHIRTWCWRSSDGAEASGLHAQTWGINRPSLLPSSWTPIRWVSILFLPLWMSLCLSSWLQKKNIICSQDWKHSVFFCLLNNILSKTKFTLRSLLNSGALMVLI